MIVKLLLFAAAKQIAGTQQLEVSLDQPCTVERLKSALVAEVPKLGPLVARSAFSVNQAYVDDQTEIGVGEEVAMIPPVSGG
jgi:molybdopterin converting factor small subunit